ncbi:hypothetical protein ABXN37_10825 [Piscinibacter sakaiensis]|uniref:hypothetical protein n=1 Tax=Piscinibacter sakaiensis TaxID=1547922 RepID=UPI00372CD92C
MTAGGLGTWALYQPQADAPRRAPSVAAGPPPPPPLVAPDSRARVAPDPPAPASAASDPSAEWPTDEVATPEAAASALGPPPPVPPASSADAAASARRASAPYPGMPKVGAVAPGTATTATVAASASLATSASPDSAASAADNAAAAPVAAASAAAAEPPRIGPGAIEWSQALQLPTLNDVPWRLGLGFEHLSRIELDGRSRHASARDCRELLAALDAGLLLSLEQDVPAANFEAANCRAIALIGRAGRATRSHVKDLRLDASSVPRLPTEVATAVDAAARARLAAATARRQALPSLFPDLGAAVQGASLVLSADDWESRLHVLARGDFDHDGQEDLLLSVIERTVDNRFENTKLFIVTRDGPDSSLRVVLQVH